MPVRFAIIAPRGLAVVRYEGHATVAEAGEAFGAYAMHPDAMPGQKQLIDLADVTSFETDFARLLALQAEKAAQFLAGGAQTVMAYHAPDGETYEMARLIRLSWADIPGIAVNVVAEEKHALDILGQPEDTIDAVLSASGATLLSAADHRMVLSRETEK